jgi:hypothetical protein
MESSLLSDSLFLQFLKLAAQLLYQLRFIGLFYMAKRATSKCRVHIASSPGAPNFFNARERKLGAPGDEEKDRGAWGRG